MYGKMSFEKGMEKRWTSTSHTLAEAVLNLRLLILVVVRLAYDAVVYNNAATRDMWLYS
jgi:hypothetical protein